MITTLLSALAFSALAATPGAYNCRVILIAKDLPAGFAEREFKAQTIAGTHGGNGYEFKFENHRVGVLSDAKWMAISWERDGKTVSRATFSSTMENLGTQVLIVGNPADEDEQVSLDCTATLRQ